MTAFPSFIMLPSLLLSLTALQLSPWKDCGNDWLGCCKLEASSAHPARSTVKFTNVIEKNFRNESGVVRKGWVHSVSKPGQAVLHLRSLSPLLSPCVNRDPFFTIEDVGEALTSRTLSNITKRIRVSVRSNTNSTINRSVLPC